MTNFWARFSAVCGRLGYAKLIWGTKRLLFTNSAKICPKLTVCCFVVNVFCHRKTETRGLWSSSWYSPWHGANKEVILTNVLMARPWQWRRRRSASGLKLGIDTGDPFEHAPLNCHFMITVVYYSRLPEVSFVREVTTTVTSFLRSLFSQEHYPMEIVSDHGSQFTSTEFKTFLKEIGIHQLHLSVYHPLANGIGNALTEC